MQYNYIEIVIGAKIKNPKINQLQHNYIAINDKPYNKLLIIKMLTYLITTLTSTQVKWGLPFSNEADKFSPMKRLQKLKHDITPFLEKNSYASSLEIIINPYYLPSNHKRKTN